MNDELIKEIKSAQTYCKDHNGIPHCKNCGLDFDKLLKALTNKP